MGQSSRKRKLIELTENMLRSTTSTRTKKFHLEFLTDQQRQAWDVFQNSDILFLIGAAGSGKSYLAIAFALHEILEKSKDKILLSRPVVEAGEKLGFLPGDINEKIYPYMLPMYDSLDKMCGREGSEYRKYIDQRVELAPLAYLRGRAQPLTSIVMTPNGPVTMGSLKVGDLVLGSNGQPIRVLGVYPQGKKDTYQVEFIDGSSTICCGEHLWSTQTLSEKRHSKGFTVKDTLSIKENLCNKYHQHNHRIPVLSAPAQFYGSDVPVDPYLLGALIGDGCLHEDVTVTFCNADQELLDNMRRICPLHGVVLKHTTNNDYRLIRDHGHKRNLLRQHIKSLGLLGRKSWNKFIPEQYKTNNVTTRLEILRGLMDTDGCCYKDGRLEFSTTSETLAKDVIYIIQSLGGIARLYTKPHKNDKGHMCRGHIVQHRRVSYRVMFAMPEDLNPFRISRKANLWQPKKLVRLIRDIKFIGQQECQCISVEADDHLYLTDGFIVTHNTFSDSVCILDEAQNCTKSQLKLFLTRLGNNSKMIITGDPSQSDLGRPDLLDVIAKLDGIEGCNTVTFTEDAIVRHPLVAQILKRLP